MTGEEEYDKRIIGHVEETARRTWEERHGEDRARRWSEGRKTSARLTEALYGRRQETEQERTTGEDMRKGMGKEEATQQDNGSQRKNIGEGREARERKTKEQRHVRTRSKNTKMGGGKKEEARQLGGKKKTKRGRKEKGKETQGRRRGRGRGGKGGKGRKNT